MNTLKNSITTPPSDIHRIDEYMMMPEPIYIPSEQEIDKQIKDFCSSRKSISWNLYESIKPYLKDRFEVLQLLMDDDKDGFDRSSKNFEKLPDVIKNNKKLVLDILNRFPGNIKYLSETLRNDKDVVYKVLHSANFNHFIFEYFNDKVRNDKSIVLLAVMQDPRTFPYISNKLKNDWDVIHAGKSNIYDYINSVGPKILENALDFVSMNFEEYLFASSDNDNKKATQTIISNLIRDSKQFSLFLEKYVSDNFFSLLKDADENFEEEFQLISELNRYLSFSMKNWDLNTIKILKNKLNYVSVEHVEHTEVLTRMEKIFGDEIENRKINKVNYKTKPVSKPRKLDIH
jgi:hypothetical protein